MLVLLVEDSDTAREAVFHQLIALGHQVHPVSNGWQAVLSCYAYNYDMVLMDLHMPVMDGWDATQMIRDMESVRGNKRVPIVAITSLFDRQACLAAGMDDYLAKPYSNMQMQAIVRKWTLKNKMDAVNSQAVSDATTA